MKFLLILMICTAQVAGQSLIPGAKSRAMMGQSVLITDKAGTVFTNPALLVNLNQPSFWCNFFNPYQLKEVHSVAAALNFRVHRISVATGLWQMGYKFYQEQLFKLGIARRIPTGPCVGLALKYRSLSIAKYGTGGQFSIDSGFSITVHPQVTFGVLLNNIFSSKLGRSGEHAKNEMLAAIKVALSGNSQIIIETVHIEDSSPDLRLAIEISPWRHLRVLVGSGFNTGENFSTGFSLDWQKINLDYALQNHPYLAQTHHFTLALEF